MSARKTKETAIDASSRIDEARRELLKLRFRRAIGEAVNGARFRELRKIVARCLTDINSKRA
ncbi:MAG: 50S ribosomal protein L29 [Holosporales bacterium]|nr:50S ribosomal protein L29 [Holosporales bacterium]